MFPAKYVALAVGLLILAGMIVSAVSPWLEPSPSEYAAFSYSGRTVGYRGLYELLQHFKVPVERHRGTPESLFKGARRVLLLEPELFLLEREKSYLARMEDWLRRGGELVVVSRQLELLRDSPELAGPFDSERREQIRTILGPDEFLMRLGVADLATEPEPWVVRDDTFAGAVREAVRGTPKPETEREPRCTGSLKDACDGIEAIALPRDFCWFEGDGADAAIGAIRVEDERGYPRIVALEYERENGRVILVSEPTLFNNIGLGAAGNAVLAYRLAAGTGEKPVVFDEYYHGALTSLGAFALAVVFPYGPIVFSILLASLLGAWAFGVRFGPPAPHVPPTRRSFLEYVDAMARLFRRGAKNRFVLQTNRAGLLDELREGLYLPHGTPEALLHTRLRQADPARQERLAAVLAEVDKTLAAPGKLGAARLMELQERLESCRMTPLRHTPSRLLPGRTASKASTAAPSMR
jgi:hypothetical protein